VQDGGGWRSRHRMVAKCKNGCGSLKNH
jgi:hypothetical protein